MMIMMNFSKMKEMTRGARITTRILWQKRKPSPNRKTKQVGLHIQEEHAKPRQSHSNLEAATFDDFRWLPKKGVTIDNGSTDANKGCSREQYIIKQNERTFSLPA